MAEQYWRRRLLETKGSIDAITSDPKYIRLKNKNRSADERKRFERFKRRIVQLKVTQTEIETRLSSAPKEAPDTPPSNQPKPSSKPAWRNQPKE